MDQKEEQFVPLRKQNKSKAIISNKNFDLNAEINADRLRSSYGIDVDGTNVPTPISNFEEINLGFRYSSYLREMNVAKPTPIQMQAISCLLNERDVIGISSTGSGKTLGYILPMLIFLEKLFSVVSVENEVSPLSLIIVPSRELMSQVYKILSDIFSTIGPNSDSLKDSSGSFHSFQPQNVHNSPLNDHRKVFSSNFVVGVCGGRSIANDISRLNHNTKILVATPGRLIDLYERNKISLSSIKYFVIDECDKLLEMGLEEQLRKIVAMVTVHGQSLLTSLWSATLPTSLERLARSAVVDPVYICTGVKDTIALNIKQTVIFMHSYMKHKKLLEVLRKIPYPPIIIFAQSKDKVDKVTELLCQEQFHVAAIHSGKEQSYRNDVIESFRSGEIDILVSTDLISRGIDIPTVTHVINFDTPDTIEDYLHRCGRTGRLGRSGDTTTFLTLYCKIANELKEMLEATKSDVPNELLDTCNFGKYVIETELGDRIKKY